MVQESRSSVRAGARAVRLGEPGRRNIRGILHQLGEAFELFAEQRVYCYSQAAMT